MNMNSIICAMKSSCTAVLGGKVGAGCEEGLTAKQDICQSPGLRLGGRLFHGSPKC